MTKDEALDLALEALELNNDEWKSLADSGDCGYWNAEDQDHYKQTNEAITAIKQARLAPVQEPVAIDGDTSDGYHTFNELYEFRKAYNAALFNEWAAGGKCSVHKSWCHHDGELCFGGGWFIVVAVLPQGQISNHYEAKDWDLFVVPEVERALFEFDGHTGSDVVARLKAYTTPPAAPVQDDLPDFIAGTFGVSRGTAYDLMREALEEAPPVQEPVACRTLCELCVKRGYNFCANAAKTTPIITTPPAQPAPVPLTLWTEAQHERAYRNSPELHKDVKSFAAFKRVAKEVAAMYGITKGQQ